MLYNFIGFIVISLRCATYMACCHWLQLEMTHYFAIAHVFGRFMSYAVLWWRKINMYKVCMFKLSQRSKFFYGRRRKKLLSKFRTKSSVNTSIGSRFHPTVVAALKSRAASKDKSLPCRLFYSRKYRIDLWSHIKPIAYLIVGCMALGYVSVQTIWNAKPVVAAQPRSQGLSSPHPKGSEGRKTRAEAGHVSW